MTSKPPKRLQGNADDGRGSVGDSDVGKVWKSRALSNPLVKLSASERERLKTLDREKLRSKTKPGSGPELTRHLATEQNRSVYIPGFLAGLLVIFVFQWGQALYYSHQAYSANSTRLFHDTEYWLGFLKVNALFGLVPLLVAISAICAYWYGKIYLNRLQEESKSLDPIDVIVPAEKTVGWLYKSVPSGLRLYLFGRYPRNQERWIKHLSDNFDHYVAGKHGRRLSLGEWAVRSVSVLSFLLLIAYLSVDVFLTPCYQSAALLGMPEGMKAKEASDALYWACFVPYAFGSSLQTARNVAWARFTLRPPAPDELK